MSVALFAVFSLAAPAAHADLRVTFKEGNTVLKTLSVASPAGQNTTLFLLNCAAPPCSETVGNFTVSDIGATNATRARVVKVDGASVDRVELKGIRVRSRFANHNLTVIYETAAGDLTAIPGDIYPYTASLLGTFVGATGIGAAVACTNPNLAFCVRLEVKANGNTVNVSGSETLASVSVPPIVRTTGAFPADLSDNETITCGTIGQPASCQPFLQGTMVARFSAANETLTLPGSAVNASANRPTQQEGLVDLCAEVEDLACHDSFVSFSAATETLRAVPKAPRAGVIFGSGANVSFTFELLQAMTTVPADSFTLMALGSGAEELSPEDDRAASRSYVAFVPGDLDPSRIATLLFDYNVVVDGTNSDCRDGSLNVVVTFFSRNADGSRSPFRGPLVMPLGKAPGFGDDCSQAALSGVNLLKNIEPRVDGTPIGHRCCGSLASLLRFIGGIDTVRIRSISFVLESRPGIDQRVELHRAQVDDQVFLPFVPTDFQKTCSLPLQGRSIRVVTLSGLRAGQSFITPEASIRTGSCSLIGTVNTALLQPDPGTTTLTRYRADLCVNGRCLADGVEFSVRGR